MHLEGFIDKNTPLDKTFDKTNITCKVIDLQKEIVENIEQMREIVK